MAPGANPKAIAKSIGGPDDIAPLAGKSSYIRDNSSPEKPLGSLGLSNPKLLSIDNNSSVFLGSPVTPPSLSLDSLTPLFFFLEAFIKMHSL